MTSDAGEEKALADIATYGCHVIHVLEDGALPPFAYSVGIERCTGAPEVIVIGLKQPLAHSVVNTYNERVRAGERFKPGERYADFVEGFDVRFVPVDQSYYEDYLGWDRWLYGGNEFSAMQLVFPTTDGVWPWGDGASESFKLRQPLLHARAS